MSDYKLPDSFLRRAESLNALEGKCWRGKARLTLDALGSCNGTSKMTVYQTCAYLLRLGVSTARLYVRLEETFGPVLDECRTPDGDDIAGPDQLRRIYAEARAAKQAPDEVLIRRIKESDEWGGQVAPPDVIAAQTRNGAPKDPPELAAYKRLDRAIATAMRHTENKSDCKILESWARWVEKRIEEHESAV